MPSIPTPSTPHSQKKSKDTTTTTTTKPARSTQNQKAIEKKGKEASETQLQASLSHIQTLRKTQKRKPQNDAFPRSTKKVAQLEPIEYRNAVREGRMEAQNATGQKQKKESGNASEDKEEKRIKWITMKQLPIGMTMLGVTLHCEATTGDTLVALPYGLRASLRNCAVKKGKLIRVIVVETKPKLEISILVNQELKDSDIRKGITLSATVNEIQDHGYTLAFAPALKKGFMRKEAHTYQQGDIVEVTCVDDGIWKVMDSIPPITYDIRADAIIAGMVFNGKVTHVLPSGLRVNFSTLFSAQIAKIHTQDKSYKVNDKVSIRILNVYEEIIHATLLPELFSTSLNLTSPIAVGTKFESSRVLYDDESGHMTQHGYLHSTKVAQTVCQGGVTPEIRIMSFSPMEQTCLVSCEKNSVSRTYLKSTDIPVGAILNCTVEQVKPHGLLLKFENFFAWCSAEHLSDLNGNESWLKKTLAKYKPGKTVKARNLGMDKLGRNLNVTMKPSLVNKKDSDTNTGKPIMGSVALYNVTQTASPGHLSDFPDQIPTGFQMGRVIHGGITFKESQIKTDAIEGDYDASLAKEEYVLGYINKIDTWGCVVHFWYGNKFGSGALPLCNISTSYVTKDNVGSFVKLHQTIPFRVLPASDNNKKGGMQLSMIFDEDVKAQIKQYLPERVIVRSDPNAVILKKGEGKQPKAKTQKARTEVEQSVDTPVQQIISIEDSDAKQASLILDTPFDWDADLKVEPGNAAPKPIKPKASHKKDQEEIMRVTSQNFTAPSEPQSTDDFEQLILADPNSSLNWIKYAAFCMEKEDNTEARLILERALKTISYREENDKLNVWTAYMNLELAYGSEESFHEIFKRAVAVMDDKKVWINTATLLEGSSKTELAKTHFDNMVKKFKTSSKVWIQYGQYLFDQAKIVEARSLMQRALQVLPPRKHVKVVIKFGQMEYKSGDVERGRTIFEGLIANYLKRLDLWSVYIDLEIKHGKDTETTNWDGVRRIFDRMCALELSSKKIKFTFKRYLDFEKNVAGNVPSRVEAVKNKAIAYVEKHNNQ